MSEPSGRNEACEIYAGIRLQGEFDASVWAPMLAWLAMLHSQALDAWRKHRSFLAETYPTITPLEWAALLDGAI